MIQVTKHVPEPQPTIVTVTMDEKTARELMALLGSISGTEYDRILTHSVGSDNIVLEAVERSGANGTPKFIYALWRAFVEGLRR